jgi:hypothetical protein
LRSRLRARRSTRLRTSPRRRQPRQRTLRQAQAAEAASAAADASDDDEGEDTEESEDLPALAEMPEYLATMTDVDELRALKRQDKRKGGKALIQARIDALKASE